MARQPGQLSPRTARRQWLANQRPGDWESINGFTVIRTANHCGLRYYGTDHHEALRAFGLGAP